MVEVLVLLKCLEVLIVHGNELRLLLVNAFPILWLLLASTWHSISRNHLVATRCGPIIFSSTTGCATCYATITISNFCYTKVSKLFLSKTPQKLEILLEFWYNRILNSSRSFVTVLLFRPKAIRIILLFSLLYFYFPYWLIVYTYFYSCLIVKNKVFLQLG